MYFPEFVEFIKKWIKAKRSPSRDIWPREVYLHKGLWDDIVRLHNFTKQDNYEYESSFFYVEKEILISKPIKGEKHSVHAHHSLQIRYNPDNYRGVYERQILLDGAIVQKDMVRPQDVPKEVDSGFLFNVHTHPIHPRQDGSESYTFFSPVDINSLLSLNSLMTGLVTDEFWLACKTDRVISQIGSVGEEMLANITRQSLHDEQHLEQLLKKEIQNWGLVIYKGEFYKNLVKVI